MASQLEHLKQSVARLLPKHGLDNPFVQGLMTQIRSLERKEKMGPGNHSPNPVTLSAGTRNNK